MKIKLTSQMSRWSSVGSGHIECRAGVKNGVMGLVYRTSRAQEGFFFEDEGEGTRKGGKYDGSWWAL